MQNLSLESKAYIDPALEEKLQLILKQIENSVNQNSSCLENSTLSHGWLGASLFYCYYAEFTDRKSYYNKAQQFLNKAIDFSGYEHYKRIYPTDSFDANIASLGIFLTKALKNGFLSFDISPYLKSIEDTLHELCNNKIKYADFSVFSGALATANFLLNTESTKRNNDLLSHIVDAIEKNAISDSSGGFYWRSPRLQNRVYLGLSHGSCMIISFLCDVYERGLSKEKCISLIEKSIKFILKQKRNNPKGLFPNFLDDESENTQFSLCYGDLGVGYGLLKGSLLLENPHLVEESKKVLDLCAKRKFEDNLTYDAGMTYGVSGLAYLYEQLHYLDSTDEKHMIAYHYWVSQIPNYSTADNDFVGFQPFFKTKSNVFCLSYGWGIVGIGITIMRYLKRNLPMMEGINHGI